MMTFLKALPVVAALGLFGLAAQPASAAPVAHSVSVETTNVANTHYTGMWHRHDRWNNGRHYGWNRGRHYGWNHNCRTVRQRVWNGYGHRWVMRTVRTCR